MLSSDTWVMFKCDAFNRLQPKSVPQAGSHQSLGSATLRSRSCCAFCLHNKSYDSNGERELWRQSYPDASSERKTRPPAFSIFAVLAIQTFALILKA